MINAAAGQQVTPAGAAIKLHFACNNNSNNINNCNNLSNNSSSNYSGLKIMEHKMSNINNSNNNNRWQKIELIRGRLSGESAAPPIVLAPAAPPMPPQAMGFYKPTLSEESEDHLSKPVAAAAAAAATSQSMAFEEVTGPRVGYRVYRSLPRSAPYLGSIEDAIKSSPVSSYSTGGANSTLDALQGITGATVATKQRLSPGARAGSGAGPAKVPATATTLRWLSMPVSKEKPLLAKVGAATISPGGAGEGEGGAAAPPPPAPAPARSALVISQPPQRTEDQENAFRRIEDVHNYAKLQDCSSDDADDDEDDDEEDEEQEHEQGQDLGEDEDEEEEEEELDEAEIRVPLPVQQVVTRIRREDTEEHVDVDVVTVPHQEQLSQQSQSQSQPQQDQADSIRPEHHARRPMNAFLIFCKRHRAIVKERYKTLENRAITKILGDWWAALDDKEKHCFTDLAQQNKDAFFNANPNFKWYKLPAPPLRTLATRPSNAAIHPSEDQAQQQQPPPTTSSQQQLQLQWTGGERAAASGVPLAMLRRNYFKLADETQMGDLSSLLQVQVQVQVPEKEYALQQVLSETSQFLSVHMPPAAGGPKNGGAAKRSLPDSNSSEEEAAAAAMAAGLSPSKKAKSSRSCKGKIYQELVNSGQLSAIAKSKSKALRSPPSVMMPVGGGNFADIPLDAAAAANTPPVSPPERHNDTDSPVHLRSVSESSSSGFFDLEEKIKELPALSLDAYLQRKRSTKKKKKFTASKKPRNSNSTSTSTAAVSASGKGAAASVVASISDQVRIKQQQQQQRQAAAAAVGSQRRKARKESITRRDVSAIEQEVASILPLTINGCYYFDQSDAPRALSSNVNGNAATILSSSSSSSSSSASASPPLSSNSSSASSSLSLSSPAAYDVMMTSSTSDLLILAEVAANRTELNSKSN